MIGPHFVAVFRASGTGLLLARQAISSAYGMFLGPRFAAVFRAFWHEAS